MVPKITLLYQRRTGSTSSSMSVVFPFNNLGLTIIYDHRKIMPIIVFKLLLRLSKKNLLLKRPVCIMPCFVVH